jgi:hypothetical protein
MKKILMVVLFVSVLLVLTASVVSAESTVEHFVSDIDTTDCIGEVCWTWRFKGTWTTIYIPQPNKPGFWRYKNVTNMVYNHSEMTRGGELVHSTNSDNWHSHSSYLQDCGPGSCPGNYAEGFFKQMGSVDTITALEDGWAEYCTTTSNFLKKVVGATTEMVFDHDSFGETCTIEET